jgi:ubiquitin-protein ligase
VSSPRLRRLRLDQERLKTRFRDWPRVQITGHAGIPPEQYHVTYRLRGLFVSPDGSVLERDEHVAEINLSLGYPRRAPQCKMLTPIFHPNFDGSSICIGDFWAASEGLDDLIIRIGRMITYQEYNIKSPLNGLAARWAAQNANRLPVDGLEIAPPLMQRIEEVHDKVIVKLPHTDESKDADQLVASIDLELGSYLLEHDITTIGRAKNNMLCIQNVSVSEYHAQIFRTAAGFVLRDLGSTKGTWIGNLRVEGDAFLGHHDAIRFGEVPARFVIQSPKR